MLVDVTIGPGLARNVGLGPGPPPSVVVLGPDETLPYIF